MSADRIGGASMERYQAQLALPQIGVEGQGRLQRARVALVGVGGLGCPAAQYLAGAGIGSLTLIDDDIVELSNLQRQVLFADGDRGQRKAEVAARRLRGLNPSIHTAARVDRVHAANVAEIVGDHDLVLDGSDNFATRYVVNDACVLARVPLVTGSLYRFEGQVTVVDVPRTPCYRCLFPTTPAEQAPCHDAGVLGPLAGVVGSIMASEAIVRLATGQSSLMSRLLLIDALPMSFRSVRLRRDPACRLCGERPTIRTPTAAAAWPTSS